MVLLFSPCLKDLCVKHDNEILRITSYYPPENLFIRTKREQENEVMRSMVFMVGTIFYLALQVQSAEIDRSKWYIADNISSCPSAAGAQQARNVSQEDGALQIVVRKETVQCLPTPTTKGEKPVTQHYTMGVVYTKPFNFTYGELEVRAKMAGPGTWPAIWLIDARCQDEYWIVLPAPHWRGGWEVDVAEYKPGRVNGSVNKISQNVKVPNGGFLKGNMANVDDVRKWHVYVLEWSPDLLIFKIDGVETHRVTKGVPDSPMFLNLGFSGVNGGAAGALDDATLPQTMYVDYARVRQNGKIIFEDDFGGECRIP